MRVAIYTAGNPHQRDELLTWCRRAGLQVVAIARDADSARGLLCDGLVDRVIVARPDQVQRVATQIVVAGQSTRAPRPRRIR